MNTATRNKIGARLLHCIVIALAVMLGSFGANPFRGQGSSGGEAASLGFAASVHAAPRPPAGDITAVLAGKGLLGGGTQGDVTLSPDTNLMQQRVNGNCAVGSAIRAINSDGTVECEADDTAGGGSGGGQTYFASGLGSFPSSSLGTLGPQVTVTVASGQKVLVNASNAFGSTSVGTNLNIWICYRATAGGDTLHTVGVPMTGLGSPRGLRSTFSQLAVIEGLNGTYEVGMCGSSSDAASWNNNGAGSVTATVGN